jgi:hypothetical protein
MQLVLKGRGPKLNGLDIIAPLTYNLLHPILQLTLLAMAAYSLAMASTAIARLPTFGVYRVASLRFVPAGRPPGVFLNSSAVVGLTLLRGACPLSPRPASGADPARFDLPHAVDMDGFEAAVDPGAAAGFSLEGTADDGATWMPVGGSSIRLARDGVRFLRSDAPAGHLRADYRPPWPWFLQHVLDPAALSAGCLTIVAFGVFRLPDLGTATTVAVMAALAANALACAGGHLAQGRPRAAFEPAALGAQYLCAAAFVRFAEARFAETFAAIGLAGCTAWLVTDCGVYDDAGYLPRHPPAVALCFLAMGGAVLLLRWRYWRRAMRGVGPDRTAYDSEWRRAEAAAPGAGDALAALAAATDRLAAACSPALARHYNRRRIGSDPPWRAAAVAGARLGGGSSSSWGRGSRGGSSWGSLKSILRFSTEAARAHFHVPRSVVGSKDLDSPVGSADQLYAQALGAAGALHRACATWVAAGDGALDHLPPPDAGALAQQAEVGPTLPRRLPRPRPPAAQAAALNARAREREVACGGGCAPCLPASARHRGTARPCARLPEPSSPG